MDRTHLQPFALSRPEVPQGFVEGHDSQLRRRATVALPTHIVLFATVAVASAGLVILAMADRLPTQGAWLLPMLTVLAAFAGATLARFSWPERHRGSPVRATILGLMVSLPVVLGGLTMAALAA